MKRANPDIVAISAHPFTTCGALKEMERQGVKPKLLIGLTSSSSIETLQGCAKQAEGIIIPTSFAPVTPEAQKAAEQVAKFGGSADLHSAAAYEIVYILKDVIESQKIMAKPDTVAADRVKMREGLAALKETKGLLGKVGRTSDREAIKPFLYVHAKDGSWQVLYKPAS
jgi:branched-chain amino acid transport system substrate-binding protein